MYVYQLYYIHGYNDKNQDNDNSIFTKYIKKYIKTNA